MVKRIAQGFARPQVLLATVGVALAAPAAAFAFGEGKPIDGGERNPSRNASLDYRGETEIIADNSTYGTRQSNKSSNGGGAIYGCRAVASSSRSCLRANNLNKGTAFTFQSSGSLVGRFTSSISGDASRPFTTNATGVATGLNADRVDGLHGSDIVAKDELKFATVNGNGTLGANRRGATGASRNLATNSYVVAFDEDVSKCSFTASPTGDASSNEALAVAGAAGDAKAVRVDAQADAGEVGFHLQVVC